MSLPNQNTYIEKIQAFESNLSGPLSGKTFSIKDCFWFHNRQPTLGITNELLNVLPPVQTAKFLLTLLDLGAIPTAFTNMFPLAAGMTGENPWFGNVTLNDNSGVVLGSTSGGAVSVAIGEVDFAIGSDSGGSIRAPAASCGVCGFTSRLNNLPHAGMIHHGEDIDGPSFITKDLNDMKLLLNALNLWEDGENLTEIIVLPKEDLIFCDEKTTENYLSCVQNIESATNLKTRSISLLSYFKEALLIRKELVIVEIQKIINTCINDPTSLPPLFQAILKLNIDMTKTMDNLYRFRKDLLTLLGDNFCIITPTLPFVPKSNQEASASDLNIFLPLANLIPTHALSFPSHLNSELSLQIIANSSLKSVHNIATKL